MGSEKVFRERMRRGKMVTEIITKKVVETGRNYFGCAELSGVELEDEG
jgi:hypothetical protein